MPIDFFEANDGFHIRQSFESPTVYLDHWAIRKFSDDLRLQNRFIGALKKKGGTLLISIVSLLEFASPEDRRHCFDTEQFFNRVMPNIFFTELAFDKIINKESGEVNNEKRFWPPADLNTLKYLAENKCDLNGNISMNGFLSMHHDNRDKLILLKNQLVSMLQDVFVNSRNANGYIDKARKVTPSDKRIRTYIILGELMRGFNLDQNTTITDNDTIDFLHAMTSLNCCNFILLDGPWEERVKKMNLRISKASMVMPIGKCFSERNDGINKFLSELELFDKEGQKMTEAIA
jgi:hypothetical protein